MKWGIVTQIISGRNSKKSQGSPLRPTAGKKRQMRIEFQKALTKSADFPLFFADNIRVFPRLPGDYDKGISKEGHE
jgi:hypothetical protein